MVLRTSSFNKRKILNDPVYGFISVPDELLFDIIEHPYFQRLRRIKQLGLTHLVYPGALHTRFHHSLGAMDLMRQATDTLKLKGVEISDAECLAAGIAILLHDTGHTPFSHSLETRILPGVKHEDISLIYMDFFNKLHQGKINMARDIFTNKYHKHFLHQLVSGQLDIDRLDFLKRDSFFSGVSEGVINTDRIIKMMNVANDELVVEAKGIYSIEKFIIARRLMYWQVYLHKTVLAAENMLIKILERARYVLHHKKTKLDGSPTLLYFLKNNISLEAIKNNDDIFEKYSELDDYDVFTSIKIWTKCSDNVLSTLSNMLVRRSLFKTEIQNQAFSAERIREVQNSVRKKYSLSEEESTYYVISNSISNNAYDPEHDAIKLLYKDGSMLKLTEASEQLNISILSKKVQKHFLCYPKFLDL